ncbi:MAG: ribonuclease P protein component [bacterium]
MTVRYTFKRSERLIFSRDFMRVKQNGRYFICNGLTLQILRTTNNNPPRLGLVVSKRVGIAVVRNRVKRLIREVFRLNKHTLIPGCDIVAVPNAQRVQDAYHDMERDFMSLCKKAKIIQ